MPKLAFGRRLALGQRRLVALTCFICGQLKPGTEYGYGRRISGGPAYIDRRCRNCRWARMEANPGR